MKHIYTTVFAMMLFTSLSFAGSIKALNNGFWEASGTWTPNRLPQDNDSIIIPSNITVTLDQNFDLNGVVIVVSGTLNFNNGKLKLDNASKVVVQSTGKITAQNSDDQIVIGNVFKFKGTQVSQLGYSYADNTTGAAPGGFTMFSTLPVTFESFYATRTNNNVQLNWSTSEELNNAYYAVERSTDGSSWKQAAVILGAGNAATVNRYSYTDKNITDAVVYYRIRQVDVNGDAHYSAIRTIRNSGNEQITNMYVSAKQTITIDFNSDVKDNVTVQVVNMNGQLIARQNYKQASYRLTLNVASACAGIYAVRVSDGNGWSEVRKIAL